MARKKKKIASQVSEKKSPQRISKAAQLLKDVTQQGNDAYIFLSLRFVQHRYQCFSDWSKTEMNSFWDFNSRIHDYTWQQLYQMGGKQQKTGFGYTAINRHQLPQSELVDVLSADVNFFELRVNQKIRVHGFRYQSVFYLCFLDKNHDLT